MAGLYMQGSHNTKNASPLRRLLRFGLFRGMRSVEIDPEDFRSYLVRKHRLHVSDFRNMHQVPIERLDAIAKIMIRDAQRLALAEGAGFGLGGMITLLPDTGLLTIITLRLIQRLCLLYGFEPSGPDEKRELWLAAATAAGIDFGKDLAEKQMIEKLAYNAYTQDNSYFPGGLYENPSNPKNAYDPQQALALLAEAGWKDRDAQQEHQLLPKPL